MKINWSLKKKTVYFLTFIILLTGAFTTVAVYHYTERTTLQAEKNKLMLKSFKQAETFQTALNDYQYSIGTIAQLPAIINYLDNPKPKLQSQDILTYLSAFNRGNADIIASILNQDGLAIASLDPAFVGNSYSFRNFFQESIHGSSGIEMAIGITSKKPSYYFSQPIKNTQGKTLGVAVLIIPQTLIATDYFMKGDNPDSNQIIADQDGIVIASNKPKQLYNSLGAISADKIIRFKTEQKFTGHDISPLSYEPIQQALSSLKEPRIFDFYDALDQEQEIISVAPVMRNKFYIINEEVADSYTNMATRIALIMSLFVMLSTLLSGVATYFALRYLLQPLSALEKGTNELSKGNLKYAVKIDSGDELEHLALRFNAMANNLRIAKSNIEAKVKERTQELEKAFREIENDNRQLLAYNEKIDKTTREEQNALQKLAQANNGLTQAKKIMQEQEVEIAKLKAELTANNPLTKSKPTKTAQKPMFPPIDG
ncbi:MAG: cache domain-containing protein [Candidatus Falkowbacteria bacterium]